MQKKIIALAVAGLMSGAAFAQTNVTVYGVADGGYARLSATDRMANNYINSGMLSGSRIGFRGTEDLGNGLKAVFEYEMNFNLDNTGTTAGSIYSTTAGNSITGTRQSYVGLAGNFGTAVVGRLQTPGYYASAKYDAFAGATFGPSAVLAGGKLSSTISATNFGRVNNAAAYISPTFSGFNAVAAWGTGEENNEHAEKENVFGLGLNYAGGPLELGLIHHRVSNEGANNVANADFANLRETLLGANYNFGVVKLLASWQSQKFANIDNKFWQVGAVVPIGAGNVHFAYGKTNMDANDRDSKSWTLAYTYGLSKRTTLYTGINRTTNDDLATSGLLAPSAGGKSTGFVAGMRHTF